MEAPKDGLNFIVYTEMNSRFGNFARRHPEFEPGFAGAAADALKMSCEHFQRGAGERSEPEKTQLE
jgi:hypothetical protein